MNKNVALIGVSGYAGTILYQLLKDHPKVSTITLYGHRDVGKHLSEIQPDLVQYGQVDPVINQFDPKKIMKEADAAFFASSAGVTNQIAGTLIEADFPVIDLSGDYRLSDPKSYEKWYKKPAAKADDLKKATYGLCEFHPKLSRYIANPGCYATATLLGLAPVVLNNLIDLDSIIVDAKSGVSGAGKKLAPVSAFVTVNENLTVYKANRHQHIPEIVQELKNWNPQLRSIQFTTTLLPITRGIMATIYAHVAKGIQDPEKIISQAFIDTYEDKPFIKLHGSNLPSIKDAAYSNLDAIGWQYNSVTGIILIVSVIDNLLKGAAGQAVQNFNMMFGFNERIGLPIVPVMV